MSGIWVQILQFVLALSLLIILHEGGHFFFARLFKTRVERFYLFFDFLFPFSNILPFSLFKKKVGDTEYGIGWFPLGGYVKIAGMVDESMDKEQMKQPPQPWEFRSKKPWQRLLIMLGGIIVNVLLAFLIYAMILFVWGEKKIPLSEINKLGGIEITDSMGFQLGFQSGDKILAVDGKPLHYFDELMLGVLTAQQVNIERNGSPLTLNMPTDLVGQIVDRNIKRNLFAAPFPFIIGDIAENGTAAASSLQVKDKIVKVNDIATPTASSVSTVLQSFKGQDIQLTVSRENQEVIVPVAVPDSGKIGIQLIQIKNAKEFEQLGIFQLEEKKYGFLASFPAGVKLAGKQLDAYVQQFKLILNPSTGAYKGVGGFMSMTKVYPKTWDWQQFWSITAFLSIVLAFMNLLPIPGLDGGYVIFTLWEMITGRKVGEKVMEVATTVGLVLLLALMLYANGNDIFRHFFK